MYADLNNDGIQINTEKDNIIIRSVLENLLGGRTLDVSAFKAANPLVTQLSAGHVIIRDQTSGNLKPMPLATANGTAYASLPAGHEYAGVLIASILVSKPCAAIMVRGSVNPAAAPYPMTSILSGFSTKLPLITFYAD